MMIFPQVQGLGMTQLITYNPLINWGLNEQPLIPIYPTHLQILDLEDLEDAGMAKNQIIAYEVP